MGFINTKNFSLKSLVSTLESFTHKAAPAPAAAPVAAKPAPLTIKDGFNKGALGQQHLTNANNLAENPNATSKTNRDGSVTKTLEQKGGNASLTQELTTKEKSGLLGTEKFKYESTAKAGSRETKTSYAGSTDAFGRTDTSYSRSTKKTIGSMEDGGALEISRTTGSSTNQVGKLALEKNTDTIAAKVTTGTSATDNTARSRSTSVATDNLGNKLVTNERSTKVTDDKVSTTTTVKTTSGSQVNVTNTAGLKDGKYVVGSSADWKSGKTADASWNKEKELSKPDKGFSQVADDKMSKAQKAGDLLAAAGLKKDLVKDKTDTLHSMDFKPGETGNKTFVGADAGTRSETQFSVGADGVTGNFKREAVAGLYAQSAGKTTGQYGEASYNAEAKLEAKASVSAKGKLDTNGLDVTAGARASASVEASISGKATTKPVTIAGVDMTAGVEGKARVSAEVAAEATGKVKITRNPPTAIAEGTVGVSAVAKAEAEAKVSAGPFAVKGSVYASAGAEAKATGVIGYENGKLRIGGSAGAALGVGAGGSVQVEIDVKMIGDAAVHTAQAAGHAAVETGKAVGHAAVETGKAVVHTAEVAGKAVHDAADINHDGKLDANDVKAAASNVSHAVTSTVSSAVNTVSNTVSSGVSAVKNTVSSTASKVAGWFGW